MQSTCIAWGIEKLPEKKKKKTLIHKQINNLKKKKTKKTDAISTKKKKKRQIHKSKNKNKNNEHGSGKAYFLRSTECLKLMYTLFKTLFWKINMRQTYNFSYVHSLNLDLNFN